ncbi:hypothetical protein ELQ88_23025 [Pseudomonas sp. MPC6]|nr:hypothetical protein ELQ88_23025 [Pseudomonas sp. MPC6]
MTQYPVGASLLAMDSSAPRLTRSHALSLTIIASKLAPTGLAPAFNPNMALIPCRSWLASECGVSVAIDIECAAAFAGKPAPTGGPCPCWIMRWRPNQWTRIKKADKSVGLFNG